MMINQTVKLSVPYHTQHNNFFYPHRTCNVTCIAMVLDFYGIKGNGVFKQLEDEIFAWMQRNNLDNENHADLAIAFNHFCKVYGVTDKFRPDATIKDCQNTLLAGNPVITAGYFTNGGHIIVLTGFDSKGFWVNDPWGEWFSNGYDQTASGEQLHYSYGLIKKLCVENGEMFVHQFSKHNV